MAILVECLMRNTFVLLVEQLRRRCCLKIFSIFSSGGYFVSWSGTILTLIILVVGLMRKSVSNYFEFGLTIHL